MKNPKYQQKIKMEHLLEAKVLSSDLLKLNRPIHIPTGSKVIVTIKTPTADEEGNENILPYPLRDMPVLFLDPFLSVAEDDWNILQ